MNGSAFPCPSCGFLVFGDLPGTYEICEICGWEDDPVQLRHPLMAGGANNLSLVQSQEEEDPADGERWHRERGNWRELTDPRFAKQQREVQGCYRKQGTQACDSGPTGVGALSAEA